MHMENLFKDRRANAAKLESYGFERGDGGWKYRAPLMDGTFTLEVTVVGDDVATALFDDGTGDEYTLHLVPSACGEFVGRVRAEYEGVLADIADKCFDGNLFAGEYLDAIVGHVRETYASELEYLWKDTPDAVWRRGDTKKWFGLIMLIPKKRLGDFGEEGEQPVTVLNVRIDPCEIQKLLDGINYFPAYHMSKKSWITLLLDGNIPLKRVYDMLAYSYEHATK